MAEDDEPFDESDGAIRPWSERSPEEHGRALEDLLDFVEATGRIGVGREGDLEYPILAHRMRTR